MFGAQTRYDDINVGLSNTAQRLLLSNILVDHVEEGNAGIYAQSTVHWTDWWRTTAGWRGDYFAASVDSFLQTANSGKTQAALGSPKFTTVFGPFYKTELFLGAGMGYHSNDARSTTITQTPGDPATPEGASPFLVRSAGAEIGVRTKTVPGLDSSVSLFYLHQDSELFFDGDTGSTVAGPPSQRTGIEFTNNYTPASWLRVDADLALSRARFLGFDTAQEQLYQSLAGFPQAQIGNAPGNLVYEAPWMVASAGITLGENTGWFSALRWRYISSRPLTEDGVFQSPPVNTVNAAVGYRFANGWRIQFDALNLLNSASYNASYAYGALLPTDSLFAMCFPAHGAPTAPAAVCQNGVMDYSIHPLEPLAFRLTLAGRSIRSTFRPWWRSSDGGFRPIRRQRRTTIGAASTSAAMSTIAGRALAAARSTLRPAPHPRSPTATRMFGSGGIQLGFDYMLPARVVLGVAADVSSGGSKTTTIADASGTSANQITVFDSESVRGRLGYAFDKVLIYATGGWAWSNNQSVRTQLTGALNNATAGTDEAVNFYLGGWTAGGGVAVAVAQNWNAFAEYRHTSFAPSTMTLPFSLISIRSTSDVSAVELGVSYKFNWGLSPDTGFATVAQLTQAPRAPMPALVYKSPAASSTYDWTGFYVGGDSGYGRETTNGTLTSAAGAPLAPYSYDVSGPLAGVFAGGNYQFNRFVIGAEGDWQWSRLTGNNQALAPIGAAAPSPRVPSRSPRRLKTTARSALGSVSLMIGFSPSALPAGRGAIRRRPTP